MKRTRTARIVLLFVLSIYLAGCGNKFFDPTQIGRFRPTPAVNVILDSLGVAEETPSAWEGAEDPKPIDVMAYETDYVFGSGDLVRVSIFELLQERVLFTNDYIVTETGKVSIPEVGEVEAAGLTESQLEEEIRRILQPNILVEPSVTVTLLGSQGRMFSILGDGVPNPGRYPIPRYDFRLTDALALAGSPRQFYVSNIYVSRPLTGKEAELAPPEPGSAEPEETEQLIEPREEMLEIIAPRAQHRWSEERIVVASTEMITVKELAEMAPPKDFEASADGKQEEREPKGRKERLKRQIDVENIPGLFSESGGRETIDEPINGDEKNHIEWIFQDGRWMPVRTGRTEPAVRVKPEKAAPPQEGLKERLPADFDWSQIGTGGVQMRVIKIPVDRLLGGDPRYNIMIRPSDSIHVPIDIIGDFYIGGNVNFQGAITLTGRPMTLKMAIAAAGGLGPLAWPKRCEVVRRIGRNKEEIVMVDLDKIARGEQPDFFIKPNDLINVGTHPTARWRAVLRNAFRATYGFGFIYDRNFADRDFGTRRPIPHWF
jgi:polysaccharide export outer membrane protein